MKVTFLLADHAQAVNGKLYINGGGWDVIAPGTPFGIAIKIDVPWTEANKEHTFELKLLNVDGEDAILLPTQVGNHAFEFKFKFDVGRPPGTTPGSSLSTPFAMNVGGLPLPENKRLEWRWYIDGKTQDDWIYVFQTSSAPSQPAAPANP